MKQALLTVAIITLMASVGLAQGGNSQAGTGNKPASEGPTKVEGPGKKTADGLQYWDIKVGTGPEAHNGQKVKVNYTGWLTNGKKFDSSVGKAPFTFRIGSGDVIKGWDEGVAGMKVGGKRQLRVPYELGYGTKGYPGVIPPFATLIFDVELLEVQ